MTIIIAHPPSVSGTANKNNLHLGHLGQTRHLGQTQDIDMQTCVKG